MKIKLLAVSIVMSVGLLFSFARGQTGQAPNTCVDCHTMLGAPYDSIVTAQQSDIHGTNDINCVDCHGGDPTSMDPDQAMSAQAGFIGKPDHEEITQLCAKCHSDASYMGDFDPSLPVDQLAKYKTSVHGQRLAQGDAKVAECASCHGAHGIQSVKDPRAAVYPLNVAYTCNKCHGDPEYMAGYNIPTDQFQEYQQSVHGIAVLENKDLGAPTCNDCHGNHGATPPGVTSISQVCGTCHALNQQLFQGSVHESVFDMMDMPECETCHGNHEVKPVSDAMLGTGVRSVCMNCHAEGDEGYETAARMSAAIDSLSTAYDSAQVMIQTASAKDMPVEDLQFNLRKVRQDLIQTRTMIHSFELSRVRDEKKTGYQAAADIIRQAKSLVREYYYRRTGFGIFTLIITLLAVLLYLKIRQIERKQQRE